MEKSYEEILRLLERLDVSPEGLVHRGSTSFLRGVDDPERNAAVEDLIERAIASPDDDPLYVVAIGAITNVTSAMLVEPRIIERIVVLWLGGHALHWPHNREFNLNCDLLAAQVALDSGVPFVRFPCAGVTTHLRTSPPEVARYVEGQGAIGDYLAEIFYDYDPTGQPGWSKVIWDIVTVAYLIDATWTPSDIVHTPILTDQLTWSFDDSRHLMRSVNYVKRNEIFGDLFRQAGGTSSIAPSHERRWVATYGSSAGGIAPTTDHRSPSACLPFDAAWVAAHDGPVTPPSLESIVPATRGEEHRSPWAGSGLAARSLVATKGS